MGFTTGFVCTLTFPPPSFIPTPCPNFSLQLGGLTLTYSVLYLSLHFHRLNRQAQHTLVQQQTLLLNSIVEPLPPLPEAPAYEVRKESLKEMLKDRWNRELEETVKNVQETDWNQVRVRWEERVGDVWNQVRR